MSDSVSIEERLNPPIISHSRKMHHKDEELISFASTMLFFGWGSWFRPVVTSGLYFRSAAHQMESKCTRLYFSLGVGA